jgi:hypothetical protein
MSLSQPESGPRDVSERLFPSESTRDALAKLRSATEARLNQMESTEQRTKKNQQEARKALDDFAASPLGMETRDAIVKFLIDQVQGNEARARLERVLTPYNLQQVLVFLVASESFPPHTDPRNIYDLGDAMHQMLLLMSRTPSAGKMATDLLKRIEQENKIRPRP